MVSALALQAVKAINVAQKNLLEISLSYLMHAETGYPDRPVCIFFVTV